MMQLPFSFCRLKLHYASYEPTIRVLHEKHHALLKEKMLTSLERDRAVGKVRKEAVKTTLKPLLIILYCACNCICVHMYFCVRSVCLQDVHTMWRPEDIVLFSDVLSTSFEIGLSVDWSSSDMLDWLIQGTFLFLHPQC